MATSSPNQDMQARYKAQAAFEEEHPEWIALAMQVINEWGSERRTLPHAVAEALEAAYRRGERGDYPATIEAKAPAVIRRQRLVKEVAKNILRRRNR